MVLLRTEEVGVISVIHAPRPCNKSHTHHRSLAVPFEEISLLSEIGMYA